MNRSALFFTATMLAAPFAEARPNIDPDADRTGSPYFLVKGEDVPKDALPLKETRADVRIAGVIAHVEVTQVYQNEGPKPIEAIYVFPGSTKSAVFGMRMKIGDRTIVATIKEKEEARRTYERAKAAGKSASLLEQHRPNVFQMNVANIMPGDLIRVELDYTELLVPEGGTYEFVYPTVVGPRFPGGATKKDNWVNNPYQKEGEKPLYKWGLNAHLSAGMPIAKVGSPSHTISPRFLKGKNELDVVVDDPKGGNRDFILRYRLSGGAVQSGLLLYEGKKENFFLMMMQPPKRVAANAIPPREYIFIVDVSGSMHGFPLNTAKRLMKELLGGLKRQDRFNVMLFSGASRVLHEASVRASRDNIEQSLAMLGRQRGGGSTQILPAMKRALSMKRAKGMSTSFVIVTDGYVHVEKETFNVIRNNLGKANVFAFGIGRSVNRHLIEGMARSGMGSPFILLNPETAKEQADKFKRYIESPVLTNIGVQFSGFNAYDVEPSTIPDLFAERPVILFGKYRGKAKGKIALEGISGRSGWNNAISVSADQVNESNLALRYLWARHRIANLADIATVGRDPSIKKEITALGLRYNLMTEYTSFVAVDSLVRNRSGQSTTVQQPLPLPQGVSGRASRRKRSYAATPSAPPPPTRMAPRVRGGRGIVDRSSAAAESVAIEAEPKRKEKQIARIVTRLRKVDGNLERQVVQRVLRQRVQSLRRCIERTGTSQLSPFVVELVIDANGRVTKLELKGYSGPSKLKGCLLSMLKRWRFPKPTSGTVSVQFAVKYR